MAYSISHVAHAELSCPKEECERFDEAKRYLRDVAGEKRQSLDLLSGIPIPDEVAPRRAILKLVPVRHKQRAVDVWRRVTGKDGNEDNNPLGDFIGFHFGWLLSKAARDIIEAHEPRTHKFFPFQILKKDGSPIGRPYWLINICVRLDAIAPEASTVVKVGPDIEKEPDNWWYTAAYRGDRPVSGRFDVERIGKTRGEGAPEFSVRKDVVAGHALWSDRRFKSRPFMSDSLMNEIRSSKLEERIGAMYFPEV